MMRHLALLLFPLLLSACINLGSGTAPSRHYLVPSLPDTIGTTSAHRGGHLRVTARLPAYLDRPELLLRRDASRIEPLAFDRWAEPPAEMISRVVAENLDALGVNMQPDNLLVLDIHRFEGTAEGALVQLDWTLTNRKDNVLKSGRFRRLAPVTPVTAEGLVQAFGMLLTDFSREITARLEPAE